MPFKLPPGHTLGTTKASSWLTASIGELLFYEEAYGPRHDWLIKAYKPYLNLLVPPELRASFLHPTLVMSLFRQFQITQNLTSNMRRVERILLTQSITNTKKPSGINNNKLILIPPNLNRGQSFDMGMMEEFLTGSVREAFFEADHCAVETDDVYTHCIDDVTAIQEVHLRIKYLKNLK